MKEGERKVESTDHNKNPDTKKSATCHYPVRFSGLWRWVKQVAKRLVHAFLEQLTAIEHHIFWILDLSLANLI